MSPLSKTVRCTSLITDHDILVSGAGMLAEPRTVDLLVFIVSLRPTGHAGSWLYVFAFFLFFSFLICSGFAKEKCCIYGAHKVAVPSSEFNRRQIVSMSDRLILDAPQGLGSRARHTIFPGLPWRRSGQPSRSPHGSRSHIGRRSSGVDAVIRSINKSTL